MNERYFWKELNKAREDVIDRYLSERISLERFSPMLTLPFSGSMIFVLIVLNVVVPSLAISLILLILMFLLLFQFVIYDNKVNRLINKYSEELRK